MLQEPIRLPVYFNTDETTRLEELDIDYNLDTNSLTVKDCYFYNIDSIIPAEDDMGNVYSRLTSGGEIYSIAMFVEQLRREIQKQRNGSNIQDY